MDLKPIDFKPGVNFSSKTMVQGQRDRSSDPIIDQYKKVAKLERHFSDDTISKINYDNITKIQKKLVTTVFWDIKNFSELAETIVTNDNLLVEFLQEFYGITKKTIFKFDGSLDKFMGDGIMALFGIPNKDENGCQDAIAAVKCALELRERFEEQKQKWIRIWKPHGRGRIIDINLRCGIHTGVVTYGNLGTDKNDQLTAIGTNVNIASRFEEAANPDKIVISSQTEILVKDHFKLNEIDPVNLKNHYGKFQAFEVISGKT